ncbi:hypothetical protein CY35_01G117600 [Sphagnum magellanicum]|jgi:uncharacterized protein (DUF342 family)|nr:hypothetical protein CY35_01G117600 [Sphagnum magellanicum]
MAPGKKEVEGGGGGTTVEDKRKTGIVQAEVDRMKQLSSTSGYATQRLRVLDKMLELLSKVRTQSETDELEILFANMSF